MRYCKACDGKWSFSKPGNGHSYCVNCGSEYEPSGHNDDEVKLWV